MRKFVMPFPLVSFRIPRTNIKIILYFKGLIAWIFKPYHIKLLYRFWVSSLNFSAKNDEPTYDGYPKPYGISAELFFIQIDIFKEEKTIEIGGQEIE